MDPGESPRGIVVFGVSGSGKTTFGKVLAERLAFAFCDADDLHSHSNIEKMRSGHPLTDEDRRPWLNAVGQRMSEVLRQRRGVVVACSALKREYRDVLREYEPATFFVFLDGSHELISFRVDARQGSFMPRSLLASQFAALEPLGPDERGVKIDVGRETADNVDEVVASLSSPSES
jgi:carbohydrate kinase (thermoresistant glucokinase family)